MEKETLSDAPIALSPSIKLTKNTKGYGWEIRILSNDVEEIARIDNQMREKFGSEE